MTRGFEATGVDYLTGEDGYAVSELKFITKDSNVGLPRFPDYGQHFAEFCAVFCHKYGVATDGRPPVVLTEESVQVVMNHFEASGGNINKVDY